MSYIGPAGGASLIERTLDAKRFNEILNDPHVRPWIANDQDGEIDISDRVADPRNVFLLGEYGGCMLLNLQPGIYEVHTAVLREGRGAWTRALTEAVGWYMMTATDAFEVLTRVPGGHIAAKAATEAQGMRYQFTRKNECRFRNRVVDVHIYSTALQDWILATPGLVERGCWLHGRMHAEAARLGVTTPTHEDDENHNRFVGAAFEMARNGMPGKGVAVYNRWAAVSRHAPIELIYRDPPTIKFDIGLMVLRGADIEVIPQL